MYKFEYVERHGGLFSLDFPFMYADDVELGVRLWRCGKRVLALPVEDGTHYGSASTGKARKAFKLNPSMQYRPGRASERWFRAST